MTGRLVSILANCNGAREHGGVGRYVQACVEQARRSPDRRYAILSPKRTALGFAERARWEQECPSPRLASGEGTTVFGPAFAIPLNWPGRSVVTVHDTLFTRPETSDAYSKAALWYYHELGLRSAQAANIVIVPSHEVAEDLSAFVDEHRIRVIPHGGDHLIASPTVEADVARQSVLYTGGWNARKRTDWLLSAWHALPAPVREGWDLVLVGGSLVGIQSEPSVVSLGLVEDSELASLYRRASLVAYPCPQEGFGLPVVEAISSGTPVIADESVPSARYAADAVMHVPAGVDAVGAWKRGLASLIADDRALQRLTSAARNLSNRLNWASAWSSHEEVFEELDK